MSESNPRLLWQFEKAIQTFSVHELRQLLIEIEAEIAARGAKATLKGVSVEHDGIEYSVVQTINPRGWKWSFERDGRKAKTGIAFSRAEAITAATRAIGQLIREQRRQ